MRTGIWEEILKMFDFDLLFACINEDELFEDRRLYETDKNIVSLEFDRIKGEALKRGYTKDDINQIDIDIHMEIQDELEIIELEYQLTEEFLLVFFSRKLSIQSDIADYIGSAFDHGIIPLMEDYSG